jgi:hypothetical protein
VKITRFTPRYMDSFPRQLEEGVLYISHKFGMAAHNCACGCGREVMTPLKPTQWKLIVEPKGSLTLHPSIGNWGFPCRSHYWIRGSVVVWSYPMSDAQIQRNRQFDQAARDAFYRKKQEVASQDQDQDIATRTAGTHERFSIEKALSAARRLWRSLLK